MDKIRCFVIFLTGPRLFAFRFYNFRYTLCSPGAPKRSERENRQQYAGTLRRWLYPPHLHPRHRQQQNRAAEAMGNFIIPCEYDDISYLGDSLFSVRKNELVGVLNSQGETILPLECSAPYNNNIFRYKNAFIVHTDVRERIPLIIDGAISTWARLSVLTNCHGNIFYIFSACL